MKSVTTVAHSFRSADESLNVAQSTDLQQSRDHASTFADHHFVVLFATAVLFSLYLRARERILIFNEAGK